MIESKSEFNDLITRLKAKEKANKLGKSLQIKLQAFKEVEQLINNLASPGVTCTCGNKTFTHRHTNWIECTSCNKIKVLQN